jgi:mannose-6-phosphate isomerase-like protein (cupin superfamily)
LLVHEDLREDIRAGQDRLFRYLVYTDLGCKQITQFAGWIPPSKAPVHYHTYEECIFILEGHGIVHTDDESCEFAAGSSIYFPRACAIAWRIRDFHDQAAGRVLSVGQPGRSL